VGFTKALAVGLCLTTAPAYADWTGGLKFARSVNFYAHGVCDGSDQVANNLYPASQISPGPIMITGVDLEAFFSGAAGQQIQYGFAGNSDPTDGDIMVWIDPTTRLGHKEFSNGTGMQLLPGDHVDFHMSCTGGGEFQGFETIYFISDRH